MPEFRSPLKAGSGVSRFLTLVLPIVVACACVWMARPQAAVERGATVSNDRNAVQYVRADHPVSHSDAIPVSLPAASPKLMSRPIEDISPGMRVLASNPENAGVDVQRLEIADVTDWRLIRYQMPKPDGSYLFVDMLRHTDELEGQSVGAFSPLAFPELAIEGDAEITAIDVCPPMESGSGYFVTTKFTHTAANVIDLRVASESEPIGTTSNHPFWSEDRQDWVQAGDLQPGEQLLLVNGTITHVVSIAINETTQPVYNLTVDAQHTYYVGASGVLVHNSQNYGTLPGSFWAKPRVSPRISPTGRPVNISVLKPGSKLGVEPYTKIAHYDEFGRLRAISDFTDHGTPLVYALPHYHLFDLLGNKVGTFSGSFPGL
ncbi:MAG: polymorphic toxin-type HINT domain-containing protein [Planctomycetaceae bacterium]